MISDFDNVDFDDNCDVVNGDDTEMTILLNLKTRFMKKKIYTFTAKLLLAVNPYQSLPLYSKEIIAAYRVGGIISPHVFSIGNEAINGVKKYKKPQCIVVTGESGSGKTITVSQLTYFLCNKTEMTKYATQVDTILDAFGNSETPNNFNSSRFLKFVQLKYSAEHIILNVNISHQLLEKSRICIDENTSGTNFHIFYTLVSHAPDCLKERFHLSNCNFAILPPRNMPSSTNSFNALDNALRSLEISDMQRYSIYGLMASILHLGNIHFENNDLGNARISAESIESLAFVAKLVGTNPEELKKVFLERKLSLPNNQSDIVRVLLDGFSASRTRDSMMKLIYSEIFRFLIDNFNKSSSYPPSEQIIAILDIPGFECFGIGKNSFEQICINFVNEKVREFCTSRLIEEEMNWYTEEGLDIPQIKFLDNRKIIEILEHKTEGIFSLLEDESKKRTSSVQNLMNTIIRICSRKQGFALPTSKRHDLEKFSDTCFVIEHFTKDVCYSTEHFLEKNTETVSMDVNNIVEKCLSNIGMKMIQVSIRPKSAIATTKNDLTALINTLKRYNSFFIHCIKPNKHKLHNIFDEEYVSIQLKTIGAVPYANLMRHGFTAHIPYDMIMLKMSPHIKNNAKLYPNNLCQDVMHSIGCSKNGFKLGRTQVFLRPKNEMFFDLLAALNIDAAQKIAHEVSERYYIRQRRSLSICVRFLGRMQIILKKERERRKNIKALEYQGNLQNDLKKRPNQQESHQKSQQTHEPIPKRLKIDSTSSVQRIRAATEKRPSHSIRYDGLNHTMKYDNIRTRCKMEECKSKTYIMCMKCGVHLCFKTRNCFEKFHSLQIA